MKACARYLVTAAVGAVLFACLWRVRANAYEGT